MVGLMSYFIRFVSIVAMFCFLVNSQSFASTTVQERLKWIGVGVVTGIVVNNHLTLHTRKATMRLTLVWKQKLYYSEQEELVRSVLGTNYRWQLKMIHPADQLSVWLGESGLTSCEWPSLWSKYWEFLSHWEMPCKYRVSYLDVEVKFAKFALMRLQSRKGTNLENADWDRERDVELCRGSTDAYSGCCSPVVGDQI